MRRLGRWTLNTLTVLSLVMCLGTVGLWVRSYHAIDEVHFVPAGRSFLAACVVGPGQLNVAIVAPLNRQTDDVWALARPGWRRNSTKDFAGPVRVTFEECVDDLLGCVRASVRHRRFGGFRWLATGPGFINIGDGGGRIPALHALGVPLWSLIIAFSLAPARIALRALRRRSAARRGLCPRCGYDLRATPARCPEWGTAAKGAAT